MDAFFQLCSTQKKLIGAAETDRTGQQIASRHRPTSEPGQQLAGVTQQIVPVGDGLTLCRVR